MPTSTSRADQESSSKEKSFVSVSTPFCALYHFILHKPPLTPRKQIRSRLDQKPFPTEPPPCIICAEPTVRQITRSSNRKGNAGRPYYICLPCGKFHCFADPKGNDPANPPCHCGTFSKRQLSDEISSPRRKVHFVCRLGGCDYYRHDVGHYGCDFFFSCINWF